MWMMLKAASDWKCLGINLRREDFRNVAQLVRASPRQGEGRRFESDRSYQISANQRDFY